MKEKIHTIIFGTDTRAGKTFDVILLWFILISVLVVVLDSVKSLQARYFSAFLVLEWFFTVVFTLEYFARIYSHPKPKRYVLSFYGIIDVVSILPAYLSLVIAGPKFLLFIRVIRLMRVFRVFKLTQYLKEAYSLIEALKTSFYKITVFFGFVIALVLVLGSLMYIIEGEENGFTDIPQSMYWAVVTITTVGYGDIAPQTVVGKLLASVIMILGYTIIAVPTGIVTAEVSRARKNLKRHCNNCGESLQPRNAKYCWNCGSKA